MELVRGIHNLATRHRGCALTVGNYDGVHLGHQLMISVLKARAATLRCPAVVLSFEPSSKEFLDPLGAPPRLTRWREKFGCLAALGVDRLVTVRFDQAMRAMTPSEFVKRLIVDGLGARHVVTGPDFRYGRYGAGDFGSLEALGREYGFVAERIEPLVQSGVRVSSTLIRERLGRGDYAGAAELLGRPYRMMGRVIHGRKLGRDLGFPTANLALKRRKSPVSGVLAVRVFGIREQPMPAVASLGTRPTVDGVEPLLEVHVFDFDGDLYGRRIEVEFVQKLREEAKFDSLDAMVKQMEIDAQRARTALACAA